MSPNKTITINGRRYDAVTGLPVATGSAPKPAAKPVAKPIVKPAVKPAVAKKPAPATTRTAHASTDVHSNVQRSQTLHRRATKKPAVPAKPITRRPSVGRHMDFAKNPNVAKFAKHPVTKPPVARTAATASPDKPVIVHPTAKKAIEKTEARKTALQAAQKPLTSKEVKDAAIASALSAPKPIAAKKKASNKWVKPVVIIASIILALSLIIFAVYKFIPSISVSLASAQAGIEATYPEYTPDGFALSQPVTYSDGEVDLRFTSNSNDTYYTIKQSRSSWDSTAVLDNVVQPAAGESYKTTKERGLTIYTYENSAAWANNGILYQISSNAPISDEQIRRIATSL